MTHQGFDIATARPRSRARLAPPALAVAAAGALLTVLAPFLTWASVTLPGDAQATTYRGLDDEMNGRFTVYLGVAAVVVVAVLALRAVKGVWILLPIIGLLVTFVGWAQTQKLQNTVDGIAEISADVARNTQAGNGIGVWLTILGGVLLLATAVVIPVTRRRG